MAASYPDGPLGPTANVRQIADLSDLTATEYFAKRFLRKLAPAMLTYPLAVVENLALRSGKTAKWNVLGLLSAATTAVTEGNDALDSEAITTTAYTAAVAKYTAFVELTEEVDLTMISGSTQEIVDSLSIQARDTIDQLNINELDDTTTEVATVAAMSADQIAAGARTLRTNKAKPHRGSPGGRFYCLLCTPEAAYDTATEGSPTWADAKAQAFNDGLTTPFDSSVANSAVHNVIVKISDNINRDATASPDDDLNLMLADEAFGVTSLATNAADPGIAMVPSGMSNASLASPTGARGTAAWRILYGVVLFGVAKTVIVNSGATGVDT